MSHESGSVPAPKGGRQQHASPVARLVDGVRSHFAAWPRRYVEMRVDRRRP